MFLKFFSDRNFFKALIRLAVPIILQNLISASMNLIDVAMIGQLGEASVAGVGLASQAFFILILLMFGISTGSAIFTAQYWGQKDVANVRRILGICLTLAVSAAVIFTIIALAFPEQFLRIYTKDSQVVALGSEYLRVVSISYVATAISFSYASVLRSTEEVRLPMFVSIVAIVIKTILSYLLIFGHLGFPEMGIMGAAVGTVIARFLECAVLLALAYRRRTAAAASLKEMNGFKGSLIRRYIRTVLPVAFNELAWSLGMSTYNFVYARIGTEAIAAMNIVSSIENLAFVAFLALSDATGILIGNRIGAGEEEAAFNYGRRSLVLGFVGAILIGGIILFTRSSIINIYNISELSRTYVNNVLLVSGSTLWVRTLNLLTIVGVLRAGGDTRFGMLLDMLGVWAIGVPLALIGGFLLQLPVYYVYLMVTTEELVKLGIGLWRFSSRRWINNLIKPAEVVSNT